MNDDNHKNEEQTRTTVPTVSRNLQDGSLIELLYRPQERRTALALYDAGRWTIRPHFDVDGVRLAPFSPNNNLIKNDVVLLPSEPQAYGSEQELLTSIGAFIHRYVDLSSAFEKIV